MSKMKLDEIDHQILDMLIENTRTPFTDIAKKLLISAGTVCQNAGPIPKRNQPPVEKRLCTSTTLIKTL